MIQTFFNKHFETLQGLNLHYRLTAREISNQNMNPFFIPDSIKEKHLKFIDGFLDVSVTWKQFNYTFFSAVKRKQSSHPKAKKPLANWQP